MKQIAIIAMNATLCLCGVPTCTAGESAELEAYLQQIRAWGMSESGRDALAMAAGIVSGSTLLSFSRDSSSGSWLHSYRSTVCPLPGADSAAVAQWQREMAEQREPILLLLRSSADRDGSGFVTTEEAGALRALVEMGYFADYLVTKERLTVDEVAKATRLSLQELLDRAEAYNEVAGRINASSRSRMPVLQLDPAGAIGGSAH